MRKKEKKISFWAYPKIWLQKLRDEYRNNIYFNEAVGLWLSRCAVIISAVAFISATGGTGAIILGGVSIAFATLSLINRTRKIRRAYVLNQKTELMKSIVRMLEGRNQIIDMIPSRSRRRQRRYFGVYTGEHNFKEKSAIHEKLAIIRDHAFDKVSTITSLLHNSLLHSEILAFFKLTVSTTSEVESRVYTDKRHKENKKKINKYSLAHNIDPRISTKELKDVLKKISFEVLALEEMTKEHGASLKDFSNAKWVHEFNKKLKQVESQDRFQIYEGKRIGARAVEEIVKNANSYSKVKRRELSRREKTTSMKEWAQKFGQKKTDFVKKEKDKEASSKSATR